ncbi:hypothetical protein [Haliangium sp.]|uniref:hypothetical protein n=1 Tax=Haliangium sp. TaxID=2663208 RepID=UPI003D0F91E7
MLAALALLGLAAGCGRADGAPPRGPAQPPPPAPAVPDVPGVPGVPGVMEVLPPDASFIVGVDVVQLRASQLYAEFGPLMHTALDGLLPGVEERCGLDLAVVVRWFVLGGGFDDDNSLVLIVEGPSKDQVRGCLARLASAEAWPAPPRHQGDLTRVALGPDEVAWLGWLDEVTLVATPGDDPARLRARLAGTDGVSQNRAMMTLVDQVLTTATLWGVLRLDQAETALLDAEALFGTVSLVSGLAFETSLRVASAEEAEARATQVRDQFAQASHTPPLLYLKGLEIEAIDRDLTLRMRLDDAALSDLLSVLREDPTFRVLWERMDQQP